MVAVDDENGDFDGKVFVFEIRVVTENVVFLVSLAVDVFLENVSGSNDCFFRGIVMVK